MSETHEPHTTAERESATRQLPLLTLKNVVVFPNSVRTLIFSRPQSLEGLRQAYRTDRQVFAVTMQHQDADPVGFNDLYEVGVIGRIAHLSRRPNGTVQVVLEAHERANLLSCDFDGPYFRAKVRPLYSLETADSELPRLVKALRSEFFSHFDNEKTGETMKWSSSTDTQDIPAGEFADAVAQSLDLPLNELQDVLETLDTRERVELAYNFLLKEVRQRDLERELKERFEEQIGKRQKEYFLNEQMKAIQDEMEADGESEFDLLAKAIDDAHMPDSVREVAEKELKKLRASGGQSHEATPIRNYLDWLTSVPWQQNTDDNLDLANAEAVLEADHYGLEKPKERILEYIAVANAVGKLKGPIICLSGPPGVGKTSLAKSIARALNRKFARISLGGVRDEAEIRGHRRTYIGSMPGKIVQTMKKVGTVNPVILLDEVDKVSTYYNGGPTAALLEVLDPEQNNAFMDHYLEVEYDLSKVLFICTANDLSTIPLPLRDRMEILELSGYTELEKLAIAKRYLLPKQMKETGIADGDLVLGDKVLLALIRGYTREAGVRGLERAISKLCRKAVTDRLRRDLKRPIRVDTKRLHKYLGVPRYQHNLVEKSNGVGMINGLAWTSVGGETLSIEASVMRGKGKIQLTGKLGDVMQESAHAALSYVRAHANELGIYAKAFDNLDVHVHVPAGGTPKDGPSAGIALTTAIVSAMTGIPIHWNVALTGEVTLRGNVLPIGGLKEKLLAAKRANMSKALIPLENRKDLAEIPKDITRGLEVVPVRHISEVFPHLLEEMPLAVHEEDAENQPATVLPADATPTSERGKVIHSD